ncbi:MAG: hypothetical protein RL588_2083 [Pseudomonadota bacterium]|jgi:hypothetical protein
MTRPTVRLALTAASLLALAACQTGPNGITSPKAAVRGFYGDYAGDFRKADLARLSPGLSAEVEKAKANEVESAARTKAGPSPTDKPNILEGEIFAGLYEGYTHYRMGPARVIGDRASVAVTFTNKGYKTRWTDDVKLVNDNGWKIDNVLFTGGWTGQTSTRDTLRQFNALPVAP